jgi:hypothetical protein
MVATYHTVTDTKDIPSTVVDDGVVDYYRNPHSHRKRRQAYPRTLHSGSGFQGHKYCNGGHQCQLKVVDNAPSGHQVFADIIC